MTRKTIGCVECGEKVPYGRLSCPACGALLASVAGGRGQASAAALTAPPVARSASRPSAVAAEATGAVETLEPETLEPETLEPETLEFEPVDERSSRAGMAAPPEAMLEPSPWPAMTDRPEPVLSPRPYRVPGASHPVDPGDAYDRSATPGAYRPPTMMLATAGTAALQPAWTRTRPAALGAKGTPAARVAEGPTAPGDDADAVDAGRFVEIADWFVIVGASLAVLGFLLPWSATVIGSSGFGSYFDNWGLASPTHLLILLGLLVVLALGVLETPVPAWLGTGVLGLVLGGLLLGLVWPYVVGPLGADVGALIVGFGGLALVVGGALASRATRHDEADPPV